MNWPIIRVDIPCRMSTLCRNEEIFFPRQNPLYNPFWLIIIEFGESQNCSFPVKSTPVVASDIHGPHRATFSLHDGIFHERPQFLALCRQRRCVPSRKSGKDVTWTTQSFAIRVSKYQCQRRSRTSWRRIGSVPRHSPGGTGDT